MEDVREGVRGAIVIANKVGGRETRYTQARQFAILAGGYQTILIAW
jgi:hypothetical protein